jgi:hypothetical protein
MVTGKRKKIFPKTQDASPVIHLGPSGGGFIMPASQIKAKG